MLKKRLKKPSLGQRVLKALHTGLKNHFIPHAGNQHVPKILHRRSLFGFSILLITLKVLVIGVGISFPAASLFSSAVTPTNIINLTNETRTSLDLPTLSTDTKLMQAAQAKAEDMFLNDYFAHTSPEGTTPWYWFKTFGYNYRSAGENLAAHFSQAEDVEAGWMASPSHRDNIVSDRYNEIGVGVAQGMFEGYQTTFVVQMFGYELNQAASHDAVVTPTPTTDQTEPVQIAVVDTLPPMTEDTVDDSEALVIEAESLVLTPIQGGYAATIYMENVNEAVLYIGNNRVPFVPATAPNTWQSVVLYDDKTISEEGERLYLVAGSAQGEQKIVDLAWIMPGADAPKVYAFKQAETPKLLGVMDIANLDDNVKKIYLFALLFLGSALAVAVLVKFEIQKPTMIAHSLAVMALILILTFI
ncbi:MAG: CAP domain-containing protein [Patescibacteria group bacterium]